MINDKFLCPFYSWTKWCLESWDRQVFLPFLLLSVFLYCAWPKYYQLFLFQSWRENFEFFDTTPFAAASIGQVHMARLLDGTEVTPLHCRIRGRVQNSTLDQCCGSALVLVRTRIPLLISVLIGIRPVSRKPKQCGSRSGSWSNFKKQKSRIFTWKLYLK